MVKPQGLGGLEAFICLACFLSNVGAVVVDVVVAWIDPRVRF
ncbi:MAG: hypothetical protein OXC96_03850 [Cyanobacteria bacterium MAG CAR1_bin_15]|nr:hypothetical protein [Cyanobacteria bacterium MAG CAR1_bin_15]